MENANQQYRSDRHSDINLEPSPFLVENLNLLPKGKALDVAMGSGRNSVFLAQNGFEVEGIDISLDAVRETQALATKKGVVIGVSVVDLERGYKLKREFYDVIICFHYLQRSLIPQMKDALKPEGVVVYETFIIDQATLFGKPRNPDFLLKHNELLDMFHDFRCLRYREGVIDNRAAIASIVALKKLV